MRRCSAGQPSQAAILANLCRLEDPVAQDGSGVCVPFLHGCSRQHRQRDTVPARRQDGQRCAPAAVCLSAVNVDAPRLRFCVSCMQKFMAFIDRKLASSPVPSLIVYPEGETACARASRPTDNASSLTAGAVQGTGACAPQACCSRRACCTTCTVARCQLRWNLLQPKLFSASCKQA